MLSYMKCPTDLGVYPKGKTHHLIFCPMNIQFVQSGVANNNFKTLKFKRWNQFSFFFYFQLNSLNPALKKMKGGKSS